MKTNKRKRQPASTRRVLRPTGERWRSSVRAAVALRRPGCTQEQAAEEAGIVKRTLQYWLAQEWWREVEEAAANHETEELIRIAVESLRANMPEDGKLSLRVLERLDPRFAPAVQRHQVQVDGFAVDLVNDDE